MARKIEQGIRETKKKRPLDNCAPVRPTAQPMGSNAYPGASLLLGGQGSHALSGARRREKINSVSASLLRAGLVRPRRRSIDQSLGEGTDLAARG